MESSVSLLKAAEIVLISDPMQLCIALFCAIIACLLIAEIGGAEMIVAVGADLVHAWGWIGY